jgi:hypothetical protein
VAAINKKNPTVNKNLVNTKLSSWFRRLLSVHCCLFKFCKEEMSEGAAKADKEENRRRRFRRRRGPPSGGRADKKDSGEGRRESQPRQPRPESKPVPAELMGKTVTGKICDVIKRGKGQFGFIYIGDGSTPRSETPRIYFSFSEFTDENFLPRKGYSVEFTCAEDEDKRAFAANVKLTAEGRQQAEEREEKLKSSPERQPREGGESRGGRRQRREEEDGRTVTLKVTCEGQSGEKTVVARLSQSIGKLKHAATKEFDAPIHYNVFSGGVLLTRALLNELKDNDSIHLKPADDADKEESK